MNKKSRRNFIKKSSLFATFYCSKTCSWREWIYLLEPEHGIAAIGSGGNFALAAARAIIDSDQDLPKPMAPPPPCILRMKNTQMPIKTIKGRAFRQRKRFRCSHD